MERARTKGTLIAAALAAAFLLPRITSAAAPMRWSAGDPATDTGAEILAVDTTPTIVSSLPQESSNDLGDLPTSPRLLDGAHERVAPRFLTLSCGRDSLPEASLSSKPDPEQGREEFRPRMGRRKRLVEVSADGRDPSRRRPTDHRASAHAHARREILLL